jgi:hypothetical protein
MQPLSRKKVMSTTGRKKKKHKAQNQQVPGKIRLPVYLEET